MSKAVAAAAIRGSHAIVAEAEEKLNAAIARYGENQRLEFPETAFYLPMANALLGLDVTTLGQAREVMETAKGLLTDEPSEAVWLPYLSGLLDAGVATLLAEELSKALDYLEGIDPMADGWHGFISDTILRTLGIQPGFAASPACRHRRCAPDTETAAGIREPEAQHPYLHQTLSGRTMRYQLIEAVFGDA
jgi:acetyl-CoA synthase